MSRDIIRKRIVIKGVVQGVGFRPFVYRNAVKRNLKGFVMNTSKGIEIEVEGESQALDDFIETVTSESPPQSRVTSVKTERMDTQDAVEFQIVPSNRTEDIYIHLLIVPIVDHVLLLLKIFPMTGLRPPWLSLPCANNASLNTRIP
ncbi:MAG: acylphosphatase [bacterium]